VHFAGGPWLHGRLTLARRSWRSGTSQALRTAGGVRRALGAPGRQRWRWEPPCVNAQHTQDAQTGSTSARRTQAHSGNRPEVNPAARFGEQPMLSSWWMPFPTLTRASRCAQKCGPSSAHASARSGRSAQYLRNASASARSAPIRCARHMAGIAKHTGNSDGVFSAGDEAVGVRRDAAPPAPTRALAAVGALSTCAVLAPALGALRSPAHRTSRLATGLKARPPTVRGPANALHGHAVDHMVGERSRALRPGASARRGAGALSRAVGERSALQGRAAWPAARRSKPPTVRSQFQPTPCPGRSWFALVGERSAQLRSGASARPAGREAVSLITRR